MRNVGYAFALGVFLLLVGFVVFSIPYRLWGSPGGLRSGAYAKFGILLMGSGFVLIVGGVVLRGMKKPEVETRIVYVPLKRCPNCGMQFSGKEYESCPACGVKLESAEG